MIIGELVNLVDAQRCRNQGLWIMLTNTPAPKYRICCWMYNINSSKRHCLMDMIVRVSTPEMCVYMAPPERIE